MKPLAPIDARAQLITFAADRGASLSALSRMIGRNVAYLQQYTRRGTPAVLAERDRRVLAQFFGVPERELGGPAPEPIARRPTDAALIDAVAAEMWDAKSTGEDDPPWVEAGEYWQRAFRDQATIAIAAVRKHDRAA